MPSFRLLTLLALLPALTLSSIGRAEEPPKPIPEAAGFVPARLERLDAVLHDAVTRKQVVGTVALVARQGKLGYVKAVGWSDAEDKKPMATDSLFRIASMTKPITSVAIMMLVEDGKLKLDDPVSKYLPEFKEPKVVATGGTLKPAAREISIHDLLTHTSGLTYRFWGRKPLAAMYREANVSDGLIHPEGAMADNVARLAKLPLHFQPGSAWEYGLSSDVLGRVVEVASGKNLDAFFAERILRPLKMDDTFFFVPKSKRDRLTSLYVVGPDGQRVRVGDDTVNLGELSFTATYPLTKDGKYFSGGAGLVTTAHDYARFLQMLLNGGQLDGVRLLKAETVQQMTTNQIGDLKIYILDHGDRFGYGVAVLSKAGKYADVATIGSYSWGGIFHTYFWVDPQKEIVGILMSQMYTLAPVPLRNEFKKQVYAALTD